MCQVHRVNGNQWELSCFMSISYTITCLENLDGHSLKSCGVFYGVYCVKMM